LSATPTRKTPAFLIASMVALAGRLALVPFDVTGELAREEVAAGELELEQAANIREVLSSQSRHAWPSGQRNHRFSSVENPTDFLTPNEISSVQVHK